jgi:hypothetical protein
MSLSYYGINLIAILCKLDHYINVNNICQIELKRYNSQKEWVIFTPKRFDEIHPSGQSYKDILE